MKYGTGRIPAILVSSLFLISILPAATGAPLNEKQRKGVIERYEKLEQGPVAYVEPQSDAQENTRRAMLRDYFYLSYLIQTGDLDRAQEMMKSIPNPAQWPPELKVLDARVMYQTGKVDEARKAVEAILDDSTNTLPAYLLLAKIQSDGQDLTAAIATLEKARKISSTNFELLDTLRQFYSDQLRKIKSNDEAKPLLAGLENVCQALTEIKPGRSSVPYYYIMAFIDQEQGKSKEAIGNLEKVVEIEPTRTEAQLQLAEFKKTAGDRAGAIETLKKAYLANPDDAQINAMLDQDLRLQEGPDASVAFFKALSEQYPGRDSVQNQYAQALLMRNKLDEALKVLQGSLAIHPANQKAWLLYAGIQGQKGNTKEVEKAMEKFIGLSPRDPESLTRVVRLLIGFNLSDEAAKYIERLNAVNPNDPETKLLSTQILIEQKKWDQALAAIQQALQQDPKNVNFYRQMVLVLQKTNRLKESIAPLEAARAKMDPKDQVTLDTLLVQIYRQLGELDKALPLLQMLQQKADPKDAVDWQLQLAGVYKEMGKKEEATKVLADIEKSFPNVPDVLYETGVIYWDLGAFDKGETLLRKTLQLDPANSEAMNTLAYLFADKDDKGIKLDEALKLVQQALTLQPGAAHMLDTLGWVYYKRGEPAKAVAELEKAAQKEGEDPTVQEHLGKAYLKLGKRDDARNHFKTALDLTDNPKDKTRLQELISSIVK